MIFGKTKTELKVGIFVFIGLIILAVFILSIGKFRTWASGYNVGFIFNFVNGVKVGAPIRFAGVDVGEVKKIEFNYLPEEKKDQVLVRCWIKSKVEIPRDSTIWVNTLGLLGEKYIEIMPGTDYDQCLQGGETLVGIDPIPMHEIFRTAKGIVENLDQTIVQVNKGEGTVGKFLHDDSVYNNLEEMTADLKKNPWKLFYRNNKKK
ncbi:MAG: MlaD family protein [Candidatus Omnitrophica bacterium]|nr:MlaD family protein [Candidatus Omnitrophota bacterium]MDD5512206.1 MlaD family protein [Candidatus Omnitrophota bacterium]